MIKYTQISQHDWYVLKNRTGYYCVNFNEVTILYKNGTIHNEYGPAYIKNFSKYKEYYLYGNYIGNNDVESRLYYTNETWIRYCKLKAFT